MPAVDPDPRAYAVQTSAQATQCRLAAVEDDRDRAALPHRYVISSFV